MPKKKGSGKGRKKKAAKEYDYQYPQLDFNALREVPKINFVARNNNVKNSEVVEGKVPIDYSLFKIKEIIADKHKNSCKNLRLYMLEGQDKKYFDNILFKTFKELGIVVEKFTLYYEFEPFVHPTLEASISG